MTVANGCNSDNEAREAPDTGDVMAALLYAAAERWLAIHGPTDNPWRGSDNAFLHEAQRAYVHAHNALFRTTA